MGGLFSPQGARTSASSFAFASGGDDASKNPQGFSAEAVVRLLLEGEGGLGKSLTTAQRAQLEGLGSESDQGIFWRDLLAFGKGLEAAENLDAAAGVYAAIVGAFPPQPGDKRERLLPTDAQARLDAIQGKGAFSPRVEFLLKRFTKDASDPKMILPMLAGTAVYGVVRGAALSRFAATAEGGLFTRGFGMRFAASTAGFVAEVPTFALSARAMRQASGAVQPGQETTVGQDLAGAAITLGLLKSFSFLGQKGFQGLHGIRAGGAATRLQAGMEGSQFAFTQGSMFAGLMVAHKIEERVGLRPHVDGATTVTDTLAAMFSLGIGAHLGHKALGKGFARWNQELNLQAKAAEENGARLPGRVAWAKNPLLAPMWMAMGMGGPSGFSGGDRGERISPVPETSPSREHPIVWKGEAEYAGTSFELQFRSGRAPGNRERLQENLQDALLDILATGEEEGTPLNGAIAERLRNEGSLRHDILGIYRRVSVVFDAEQRRIVELRVFQDGKLKLELTDPPQLPPELVPLHSEIRGPLPAAPRLPADLRPTTPPRRARARRDLPSRDPKPATSVPPAEEVAGSKPLDVPVAEAPEPEAEASKSFRSVLGLTRLQQAIFDAVGAAGAPVQGKEIVQQLKGLGLEFSTAGLYHSMESLEGKGLLKSFRRPNPKSGLPDLRFYSHAAEPAPKEAAPLETAGGASEPPPESSPVSRPASERPIAEAAFESPSPKAVSDSVGPEARRVASVEVPEPPASQPIPNSLGENFAEVFGYRHVSRNEGERGGLMGLGRAFRFFTILNSGADGTRRMLGNLILPNLDRLSFIVEMNGDGDLRLAEGGAARLWSARTGKGVPVRLEKSEGYLARLRFPDGQGLPAFEFDLSGVRDRAGAVSRLELAANQPKGPEDVSSFFSVYPPRSGILQVLHVEQVAMATNRGRGGNQQRFHIYLSNGDFIETMIDTIHHSKGSYEVKEARLHRLGFEPDQALTLNVVSGASGKGGKNRIVYAREDLSLAVEMECEVPSNSTKGALILRPSRVLKAPRPVNLALRPTEGAAAPVSAPPAESRASSPPAEEAPLAEPESAPPRQSSSRPPRSDADRRIEALAVEVLSGDFAALERLGEQAAVHPSALRELEELCDLALAPGAQAEEFGGLPPEKVLGEIRRSLGLAVHFRPEVLELLSRLHEAGVPGSLGEIADFARTEQERAGEALQYLATRAAGGETEATLALARLSKDAETALSRAQVRDFFDQYPGILADLAKQDLDDPKHAGIVAALFELAEHRPETRAFLEAYATAGRVGDAGRHMDFLIVRAMGTGPVAEWTRRRLESLVRGDPGLFRKFLAAAPAFASEPSGTPLRELLRNYVLKPEFFYRPQELRQLAESFSNPQAAARLAAEEKPSEPPALSLSGSAKGSAAKPAKRGPSALAQMEIAIREGMSGNMRKLQKRKYYDLFLQKSLPLTMEERLGLVRRHLGIFEQAVQSQNARKLYLNLDLLHALSHRLDEAGHRELVERLAPLRDRFRFVPELAVDFDCMMRWHRFAEEAEVEAPKSDFGLAKYSQNLAIVEDLIHLMRKAPPSDFSRYQRQMESHLEGLDWEELRTLADALNPHILETGRKFQQGLGGNVELAREKEIFSFISLRLIRKISPELEAQIKDLYGLK